MPVEKAPLWVLAQQSEEIFEILLRPRLLIEDRYQSLETIQTYHEHQLLEIEFQAVEVSNTEDEAETEEEKPETVQATYMLSQILLEFDSVPSQNQHVVEPYKELSLDEIIAKHIPSGNIMSAIDAGYIIQQLSSTTLGRQLLQLLENQSADMEKFQIVDVEQHQQLLAYYVKDILCQPHIYCNHNIMACLSLAWMSSHNHLPGSQSESIVPLPLTQSSSKDQHDETPIRTFIPEITAPIEVFDLLSENGGNSAQHTPQVSQKRDILSIDSEGYFTQASKKSRLSSEEVVNHHVEAVSLITPTSVNASDNVTKKASQYSGVVDLCMDDYFDIYELPPEPDENYDYSVHGNAYFSYNQNQGIAYQQKNASLLEEMNTVELRHNKVFTQSMPSQPPPRPPPPSSPILDVTSTSENDPSVQNSFMHTNNPQSSEPAWEVMSDEELLQMARDFGLKSEPRGKLLKLLKAMWVRLKGVANITTSNTNAIVSSQQITVGPTRNNRNTESGLSTAELRSWLMKNKSLYEKILLFIPVEVDEVHAYLRSVGQKVSKTQLLSLLDGLAIFVSSGPRKDR
jgi:hypothetical protein